MQLALPVSLPLDQTFDSFYTSTNADAVSHLQDVASHSTHLGIPLTLLCGKGGVGKSHLLFSLCHIADETHQQSVYLNFEELNSVDPIMLSGLEHCSIICLDNIHCIVGHTQWETALFDLINRINEAVYNKQTSHLVISMNALPNHLGFVLPDLLSRLNWGTTFYLEQPDDKGREAIIKRRAKAQGMNISDAACKFLLVHTDRHLNKLMALLEKLDQLSLQSQTKITLPLLKKHFSNHSNENV